MQAGSEFERAKRDLLRRISRNRRHVDGRIHAIRRRSLRWIFWGECAIGAWRRLRFMWTQSAADSHPDQPGDDHGRS